MKEKSKTRTVSDVKSELERLTNPIWIGQSPKVLAAVAEFRRENREKVESLTKELEALRGERKPSKRWPDDTPEWVVTLCKLFWSGTTESHTFRIHEFNEKAIWTSYPVGGYSTVGGFTPTPPSYRMISRTETEQYGGKRPKLLKDITPERNSGKRVTPAIRLAELAKLL